MLAAVYQGRWPDQIARVIGLFGYSIPIFWLGLMGAAAVLRQARLGRPGRAASASPTQDFVTPVTGVILIDAAMQGEWEVFWDAFSHLILPASVLGFSASPISAA